DFLATPIHCPAIVDDDLARQIGDAAVAAYRLIGCRDYGRVDLRIDRSGRPSVLEVNANPDLSPEAGLARMLGVAGIPYAEFIERLVRQAYGRRHKTDDRRRSTVSRNRLQAGEAASAAIRIRHFASDDRDVLVELTRSCGAFRPDEIEIADEVL